MTVYTAVRTGSDGSLEATAICSSIGCFMSALVGALIGEKLHSSAG